MAMLTKEEFIAMSGFKADTKDINFDYLYEIYSLGYEGIEDHFKMQKKEAGVDNRVLFNYIFGEYLYSTTLLKEEDLDKFLSNERIKQSMASVSADKYLSLSTYRHKENAMTSPYLPPISSLALYLNLMMNIVSMYKRNDPKNTLIVDLMMKSLSIAQSSLDLLCAGYETEAFAIWRTLHECECTLILLDKYRDIAINAYLKHMNYGLAFRGVISKEETDKQMAKLKEEMAEHDLKSKDTKKYIEYGWLYALPKEDDKELKLNFRDGIESLAGLHQYHELYMMSSEILHSTPLLIYSNKQHFFFLTLLNLYESFFRIEKVFLSLFFSTVGEEEKKRYLETRALYYSQLVNIHQRETLTFKSQQK